MLAQLMLTNLFYTNKKTFVTLTMFQRPATTQQIRRKNFYSRKVHRHLYKEGDHTFLQYSVTVPGQSSKLSSLLRQPCRTLNCFNDVNYKTLEISSKKAMHCSLCAHETFSWQSAIPIEILTLSISSHYICRSHSLDHFQCEDMSPILPSAVHTSISSTYAPASPNPPFSRPSARAPLGFCLGGQVTPSTPRSFDASMMLYCSKSASQPSTSSSFGQGLPPTTHVASPGKPRFREFTPSPQSSTSFFSLDTLIDCSEHQHNQCSRVVLPCRTLRPATAVQR